MTIQAIVADPGCLFRIPDPNFFHPWSRIRLKEFKYFNTKKPVSKHSEIWSGFFIPDPDPDFFFTHTGSRGQKGTGPRIRIRNTGFKSRCLRDFQERRIRKENDMKNMRRKKRETWIIRKNRSQKKHQISQYYGNVSIYHRDPCVMQVVA